MTLSADTADHVAALQLLEKHGDIRRDVLAVAVHDDDNIPSRRGHSRPEGRVLAAHALSQPQPDDSAIVTSGGYCVDNLTRCVR